MSDRLLSVQVDQAMVLTISNPEMRNALGPNVYTAGVEALNAAETNPDVRTVIITGEGAHFCGGGNLNRLLENRQKDPVVQAESIAALHNWIDSIRTFPKPVIAAVEGAAAQDSEIAGGVVVVRDHRVAVGIERESTRVHGHAAL